MNKQQTILRFGMADIILIVTSFFYLFIIYLFMNSTIAYSAIIGCVLTLINFFVGKKMIYLLLMTSKNKSFISILFITKLFLYMLFIFFIIRYNVLDILGLTLGLSYIVVGIFVWSLIIININFKRIKNGN